MVLIDSITPKAFQTALIVVVVLFASILTAYQLRFYIQGPIIIIDESVVTTTLPYHDVSFIVRNANNVSVSGRQLTPQVSGLIEDRLYLQNGLNVFVIQASDTYGSTKKEYLYITYPQ